METTLLTIDLNQTIWSGGASGERKTIDCYLTTEDGNHFITEGGDNIVATVREGE